MAKAIGVKTENLLLSQPDCGEQALSLVDTLIRSGSVDVVVVDSVSTVLYWFVIFCATETSFSYNFLYLLKHDVSIY